MREYCSGLGRLWEDLKQWVCFWDVEAVFQHDYKERAGL